MLTKGLIQTLLFALHHCLHRGCKLLGLSVPCYGASITLLFFASTASAELNIVISKAYEGATPIAVLPFSQGEVVSDVVHSNLMRSGKFNTQTNALQQIDLASQINNPLWLNAGIRYVVVGKVTPPTQATETTAERSEYAISYELVNTQTQQRLLGEQLYAPTNRLREAGHLIADKIFKAITGVQGDFSGRLAYVLKQKLNQKTYYILQVADTDGVSPRSIFKSEEPVLSPTFSPDGKKIAYVSFETGKPAIYLQALRSGERDVLANFNGLNGAPSFSPDGTKILFTSSMDGNAEIYELTLATKALRRLTNHLAIDTEATYSRDGRSFVFTSDRAGSAQLYQYDLITDEIKRLTFEGLFNGKGSLSPDLKQLAFVHRTKNTQNQLAVQDLRTGFIQVLSNTAQDDSPIFSPNGQMLAFTSKKGGGSMISIVSVDGNYRLDLPSQEGDILEPAWSPFR